jgi:hypothetical protein
VTTAAIVSGGFVVHPARSFCAVPDNAVNIINEFVFVNGTT